VIGVKNPEGEGIEPKKIRKRRRNEGFEVPIVEAQSLQAGRTRKGTQRKLKKYLVWLRVLGVVVWFLFWFVRRRRKFLGHMSKKSGVGGRGRLVTIINSLTAHYGRKNWRSQISWLALLCRRTSDVKKGRGRTWSRGTKY